MGFATCIATCFACGRTMMCNPHLVPSVRDPKTGEKEPVCLACIEHANPLRVAKGLDPITVLPGAYDACDENEL